MLFLIIHVYSTLTELTKVLDFLHTWWDKGEQSFHVIFILSTRINQLHIKWINVVTTKESVHPWREDESWHLVTWTVKKKKKKKSELKATSAQTNKTVKAVLQLRSGFFCQHLKNIKILEAIQSHSPIKMNCWWSGVKGGVDVGQTDSQTCKPIRVMESNHETIFPGLLHLLHPFYQDSEDRSSTLVLPWKKAHPTQRERIQRRISQGYLCPQGQRRGNNVWRHHETKSLDAALHSSTEWWVKTVDLRWLSTTAAALFCVSSDSRNTSRSFSHDHPSLMLYGFFQTQTTRWELLFRQNFCGNNLYNSWPLI